MAKKDKGKDIDVREIEISTNSASRFKYWRDYLDTYEVDYEHKIGVCGSWIIKFNIDYNKLENICSGLLIPVDQVTIAYFE